MRRAGMVLIVAAVLAVSVSGCGSHAVPKSGPAAEPPVRDVLGATPPGQAPVAVQDTNAGVDAASVPRGAFKGVPGAETIAIASGLTPISRERAIEIAQPGDATGNLVPKLVSAVHVTLPARFVAALTKRSGAKATDAWIVTYGNIVVKSTRGVVLGDRSVAVDATTGEVLGLSQYAAK